MRFVLALSVVVAFGSLGVWLGCAPVYACGGGSREKLAHITVQAYATQAYWRWSFDNPEGTCPRYVDELARYMGEAQPLDPWETRLEMVCAPPVGEFGVVSAGPDRVFRTVDDIHSWDQRP
jgi:hypothetical protein